MYLQYVSDFLFRDFPLFLRSINVGFMGVHHSIDVLNLMSSKQTLQCIYWFGILGAVRLSPLRSVRSGVLSNVGWDAHFNVPLT